MTQQESTQQKILQVLKENIGRHVSGNLLATRFGLSRTGIWKHIQHLKSLDYAISTHPREGYRLTDIPDRLMADELVPELGTLWLGRHYHYFLQIGSTNDRAMELASQGAVHGTLVVAEEQTKGKGRLSRPWISAPSLGIYLSIILRSPLPLNEAHHATTVAAISLAEVLGSRYGLSAMIKWPNDILVMGKKLAGILTELQSDQDLTRFLVVGIGVNVNHSKEDLVGPFRYPATSVAMEAGHPVSRKELLLSFLERFEAQYDVFLKRGFSVFLPRLTGLSAVLGKTVRITSGNNELTGKALGFTEEGGLRILLDNGKDQVIWVGDITQLEGSC